VKKINTAPKWVSIVTAILIGLICLLPLFSLGYLIFIVMSMEADSLSVTSKFVIEVSIFIIISLIISYIFGWLTYKLARNIRKELLYIILAFILVTYIGISPRIYTFVNIEELTTNIKIEK